MPEQIFLQNKYKIEEVIGKGGMGKVYKAIDVNTNTPYAIKQNTMSMVGVHSDVHLERIKREYYFLSKINHSNVIKAYDFFIENQKYFIVVEYVPGLSLKQFLQQKKFTLSISEQLCVAIQISRAIETINMIGLIHRDIKPSNIIINEKNHLIKLLDLGVAKAVSGKLQQITEANSLLGTLSYMSPEQLHNQVEKNTDVFSLGLVLYQFFLWREESPFSSASPATMMDKVQNFELPHLVDEITEEQQKDRDLYIAIGNTLQKTLLKKPEERTSSAGIVANELCNIYNQFISQPYSKTKWKPTDVSSVGEKQNLIKIAKEYQKYYQRQQLIEKYKKNQKYTTWYLFLAALVFVITIGTWFYQQQQYTNIEKQFQKSYKFFLEKDFASARKENKQILLQDSQNLKGLILKNLILFFEKDENYSPEIFLQNSNALIKSEDPFCIYALGIAYKYGLGVAQDSQQAKIYLRKSVTQKNLDAIVHLSEILLKSEKDDEKEEAINLLMFAADQKHIPSIKELIRYYMTNKDMEKLTLWAQKGASLNDPFSRYMLANMYHNQKKYKERDEQLEIAARSDHLPAIKRLVSLYQYGSPADVQKALYWGEKVLYQNDIPSILYVANIARQNQKNDLAIKLYQKAGSLGDTESYRQIANIYYHQQPKNFRKAYFYFEKAANLGDSVALSNIGSMYANGIYVKLDFKKAYSYFEKAAELGNSGAMVNLSIMYEKGDGVEQDFDKSLHWLKKSADYGNSLSMLTLGEYYLAGKYVEKSKEQAIEWLQKSSAQGNLKARKILSHINKDKE